MRCFFPGSFDPVTKGHMDIIRRAAALFDGVTVAVMINPAKKPLFSAEERVEMIKKCCKELPNVTVTSGSGFTYQLAKDCGCDVLLRSLRSGADADLEVQLAMGNRAVGDIDTVAMFTSAEYSYISSSLVREILAHHGDVSKLVPEEILEDMK